MPNFIPLFHVDTFALAASLQRRWGLFKPSPRDPGLHTLPIRGPAKDSAEDDDRFGLHAYASGGKWPELANLRREIERRGEAFLPPGIEFGRIFFELLDPGAMLEWSAEVSPYFNRWDRALLPIRTNPATAWMYGTETASPGAGFLTLVASKLPHCAINLGEHQWCWLVLDFRKKGPTE